MTDVLEILKLATELAAIYLTVLQFFVAICTVFGGWVVVNGLPRIPYVKPLLSFTFVVPTSMLVAGMASIDRRLDATIEWAERVAVVQGVDIGELENTLFRTSSQPSHLEFEVMGMSALVFGIVVLIFLSKEKVKKEEG